MLLDLYKVVIANTIEGIHLPSGSSVDVRSDKQLSCPIVLACGKCLTPCKGERWDSPSLMCVGVCVAVLHGYAQLSLSNYLCDCVISWL